MNVANGMDQLNISSNSPIAQDTAVGLVTGDQHVRASLRCLYNASVLIYCNE